MPAIGIAIAWGGYTLALWGFVLLKGYNITLPQLVDPVHIYDWQSPGLIPATQILPGGTSSGTAAAPQAV